MATLIVETGAGLSNANSYVDTDYADAYLTNKGTPQEWTDAADTDAALIASTQYIDAIYSARWFGYRQLYSQALAWPRINVLDRDGFIVTGVPRKLKEATVEIAIKILQGLVVDNTGTIKRKRSKVGEIESEVEYVGGRSPTPYFTLVENLLSEFTGLMQLERS